jgi:hypothetical protein
MNFEKVKELFNYQDGNLYWEKDNGSKKIKGIIAGYINKDGYRAIRYGKKLYLAHRLVYLWHKGYLPIEIDHIDRNKQNNAIENLRECTKSENHFNRSFSRLNTSGYKNVTWNKALKKWQVGLTILGKYNYFGTYYDAEVANFVAEIMRNKYHKQFANNGKPR